MRNALMRKVEVRQERPDLFLEAEKAVFFFVFFLIKEEESQ